jgi:WD40 repeat protein
MSTDNFTIEKYSIDKIKVPKSLITKDSLASSITHLICGKCDNLVKNPIYCQECISLTCGDCTDANSTCTFCKKKLSEKPDIESLKTLNNLSVSCPNRCESNPLKYQNLLKHLVKCKRYPKVLTCKTCNKEIVSFSIGKDIAEHKKLCNGSNVKPDADDENILVAAFTTIDKNINETELALNKEDELFEKATDKIYDESGKSRVLEDEFSRSRIIYDDSISRPRVCEEVDGAFDETVVINANNKSMGIVPEIKDNSTLDALKMKRELDFLKKKFKSYHDGDSLNINKIIKVAEIECAYNICCLLDFKRYFFISGTEEGFIMKHEMLNKSCIKSVKAHDKRITSLVKSNNTTFISSGGDSMIKVWDYESLKCLSLINYLYPIKQIALNKKTQELYSISTSENKLIKWDLNTYCKSNLDLGQLFLTALLVKSGSNTVIAGSEDANIYIVKDFKIENELEGHEDRVSCICKYNKYNMNENFIASASDDKTIRLWDIELGTCNAIYKECDKIISSLVQLELNFSTYDLAFVDSEGCLHIRDIEKKDSEERVIKFSKNISCVMKLKKNLNVTLLICTGNSINIYSN